MIPDFSPSSLEAAVAAENRWQHRILLGIEHQRNRQLLEGLLGEFYSLPGSAGDSVDKSNFFDLCILDVLSFHRFAPQVKAQRAACSPLFLPCLLLLKRSHLTLLTNLQRQRVDDVITMPVDKTELLMRVESLLRARQQSLRLNALLAQEQLLEQQLKADNQILQLMAVQDGLTGIPNRRGFDEKLAYEWKLGCRESTSLVVVLCDVDHFKSYNDTYGHVLGDQCLKAIAGVLNMVIRRPADMAARYGGEEFALVLPNTQLEGAQHILDRLQRTLRARALPHQNSPINPFVTLSCGVAEIVPRHDVSIEALLQAADTALYQAKSQGRNQIKVAPAIAPCA